MRTAKLNSFMSKRSYARKTIRMINLRPEINRTGEKEAEMSQETKLLEVICAAMEKEETSKLIQLIK
jgi:hypothetical protein